MLRRNGTRRHVVWCVSERRASEGRAVALWRFEAKMSAPAENGSAPVGAPLWSPRGLNLIQVCARWCPTLPHPGGCSTIGAVRLSFRVRDGYRAFPCRCDHRDDYVGSARPSSLVRLYSVVRVTAPSQPTLTRACAWCVWLVVGLGVDRIVDASRFLTVLTPHRTWRVLGCCCLCWPISTSQLTDRCRSSTSGLSTQ